MTESSKADTDKAEAPTAKAPAKTRPAERALGADGVVPPGTPMFSAPVDGEPTGVHVPGQPPGGTVGDGPVVLHYNPAKK